MLLMGVVKEHIQLAFGSVQFGKEGNTLFLQFLFSAQSVASSYVYNLRHLPGPRIQTHLVSCAYTP